MPTPRIKKPLHVSLGALIAIGVVVLAGAVAGAWYYTEVVTKQDTSTPPPVEQPKDDPTAPTNPDQNKNIFKIPELGIQFELPEGLEGLEYEMVDTSYVDEYGRVVERMSPGFTTKKLRESGERCGPGATGSILKVPASTNFERPVPDRYKKALGDSYLIINTPQQPCSLDQGANALQSRQVELLVETLQTAQFIEG